MVKTKIICTIGPSSSSSAVLRKMMLAGMDVVRLNFSHGSREEHHGRLRLIKLLNAQYRRHVRILTDLEGYRVRIGMLPEPVVLRKKQIVFLSNKGTRDNGAVIPFDYAGPLTDIKDGSFIYIDDGTIALRVKSSGRHLIKAETVVPGIIKERKGINIPDVNLRFKGLTDKDKQDLEFIIKQKPDYIAQSFVRNKQDITVVRDFVRERGYDCKLIAKIENRQGIKNLENIMDVCDGIMIARGDMGVSLPIYEIPVLQKMIIKRCNRRKKFVITATQMLESMTEHIRPTRAEVTDVANAVLDGTDFLMLSGETAAGAYPVESVRMMNRIAAYTEEHSDGRGKGYDG
jgi:pyruvate kinase